MGDKKGQWSENLDWDEVQCLKVQIEEITDNMNKRAWGHADAKKCMGGGVVRSIFKDKAKDARGDGKKGEKSAPSTPLGSPTSVIAGGFELPPVLAI